jgi:hypothetical protein
MTAKQIKPHPIAYSELRKKLRSLGVTEKIKHTHRNTRILCPKGEDFPFYPIHHHGDQREVKIPEINAILRRFGIDPNDFWIQ